MKPRLSKNAGYFGIYQNDRISNPQGGAQRKKAARWLMLGGLIALSAFILLSLRVAETLF